MTSWTEKTEASTDWREERVERRKRYGKGWYGDGIYGQGMQGVVAFTERTDVGGSS